MKPNKDQDEPSSKPQMASSTHDFNNEAPSTQESAINEVNKIVGLTENGRVEVDLDSRLVRRLSILVPRQEPSSPPSYEAATSPTEKGWDHIRMNIVIQVVGSRGDVQPFVALGCELMKYGHQVRLATHGVFRDFVTKSGLEFFSIGGDPAELMAYMVKNPGLIPSIKSLRQGDIQKKRKMVEEMLRGCWRSCIEPDDVSGKSFVAEAIIANPPSFAHIHCAQALGIPVHLMFTMPWTSTRDFCHPLANLKSGSTKTDVPKPTANYISYFAVEWMTWQGLGDIVNEWRKSLGLEEVPFSEGPLLAETLQIPFTYCWSPALVPKPLDWAGHIDVCGFFFRDPPKYEPEAELAAFLHDVPPPVYIGFGSIVIDDPDGLTNLILEAVEQLGVRAIVSKGWSKLGSNCTPRSNVLFLGDCPHEWLFQKVSAVVHHGGAGTTACGLLNGRPTTIVPFFGDQPFWGDMVATAGAGSKPIPFRELNAANLATAIQFCLTPEAAAAAEDIARRMRTESGVHRAVSSFHAHLPLNTMRCDLLSDRPATWIWQTRKHKVKLSNEAVGILLEHFKLDWTDLRRFDTKPIDIELRRWDPITATLSSFMTTGYNIFDSTADIIVKPIQVYARSNTNNSKNEPSGPKAPEGPSASSNVTDPSPASSIHSADSPRARSARSTFGEAVLGSASGVGGFFAHGTKALVDIPLAMTEGMRVAPKYYGGEVYNPGVIRDWKTGGIAAGKNFAHGITHGIAGLVTEPYKGAKQEGALGAAKGAGVGLMNMGTKFTSGALGLVAMTGQGIYKSVYSALHHQTSDAINQARRLEVETMPFLTAAKGEIEGESRAARESRVLHGFDGLKRS